MKRIASICSALLLLQLSVFAQKKTVVSDFQNYERGIASSKFTDTCTVTIDYDLDAKKVSISYPANKEPKYADLKSLSLGLAFVDKESNAPGIYAETLDKDVSSVLFYDDHIEIHYRNGNLSMFNALHAPAAAKPSSSKTAPTAAKPKTK